MTIQRKLVRAEITALGDNEVEVVMSTDALARDGHILLPQGCVLDNYRANPIVLWSHDPDKPIGNAENIVVGPDRIAARVAFAPAGISTKADEICGLTKAGVIRAVSVGFEPIDTAPLDPKKPRGGQRISAWDLLELSFVSVGADVGALVTARTNDSANGDKAMADWKVGAKTGLPIEDSDDWDGPAAQESVFAWAGGDDFDPAKARQGFLVYDASAPKERGSYKLPIAHAVGGELKVPKGAIRAAASRLPQTDIPDEVKTAAGEVLDRYRKEAGMGDENRSRRRPAMKRNAKAVRRGQGLKLERGLYAVSELAWLFECLGWQVEMAKFEAACEGDGSKVPGMLVGVLHDLGDALLAMTAEEIAEALAGCDEEPEEDDGDAVLTVDERAYIAAAKTPGARAFRRGLAHAKLRSGKTLSADTVAVLREAKASHEDGLAHSRAALRSHRAAIAAVDDLMDRSGVSDDDDDDGDDEDDTDSQEIQTSDGIDDSEGSDNDRGARPAARRATAGATNETLSADFRRRQADKLRLVAIH